MQGVKVWKEVSVILPCEDVIKSKVVNPEVREVFWEARDIHLTPCMDARKSFQFSSQGIDRYSADFAFLSSLIYKRPSKYTCETR